MPRTDTILVPGEGKATISWATGRIKQHEENEENSLSRLGRGFGAHQPPAHLHLAYLYPSLCSACLTRSSALVVPFPTQLSQWPGQFNIWRQEGQETGNRSPSHLCRFLKKKFLHTGRTLSDLSYIHICPFSPTPCPKRLWSFSLKPGEDAPGSP